MSCRSEPRRLSLPSAGPSADAVNGRTAAPAGWLRVILMGLLSRLLTWQDRMEQRAALGRLDARMLKDIGLSPADARREADKPFWRP